MKQAIDRHLSVALAEAQAARSRFRATVDELRNRLDPRTIASETVSDAVAGASHLLAEATTAAKARPWLIGLAATIAGIAMTVQSRTGSTDEHATKADDGS